MNVWVVFVALALLSPCAVTSVAVAAKTPGVVGGPSTRPVEAPPFGARLTPTMIIGVGQAYDSWIEVDAFGWSAASDERKLCVWIEYEREQNFASCRSAFEVFRPIEVDHEAQALGPKRLRYTEIGGPLSPNVARVIVSFRRPGARRVFRLSAVVAQVGGELGEKLAQDQPLGYFVAKIHGLIRGRAIKATAFDGSGGVIGVTRGL